MTEDVAVECEVITETDEAYLIDGGDIKVWVPKKLVDDVDTDSRGRIDTIYMQEWFALKEGLI